MNFSYLPGVAGLAAVLLSASGENSFSARSTPHTPTAESVQALSAGHAGVGCSARCDSSASLNWTMAERGSLEEALERRDPALVTEALVAHASRRERINHRASAEVIFPTTEDYIVQVWIIPLPPCTVVICEHSFLSDGASGAETSLERVIAKPAVNSFQRNAKRQALRFIAEEMTAEVTAADGGIK